MAQQTKASSIGWMFVPQYYTFVNKDPARLHCFYTKRSTLIHGVEGEDCPPCYGQQEIHEKIMSLGYEDCKVFVSTVDSQGSAESGIVVQVVGELSNKGGPWRKFAQTFFLAEQPNGYYVLNDIFRYIKEESDDDEQHEQEQDQSSAVAPDAGASQIHPQQDIIATSTAAAPALTSTSSQQQATSSGAEHHDFELSNAHGPSSSAAPVTMAPPTEAGQSETRATLEGLANGTEEQHNVVELHDEIQQQQQQASQAGEPSSSSEAPEAAVSEGEVKINGAHKPEETPEQDTNPASITESNAPEPIARPAPSPNAAVEMQSSGIDAQSTDAPAASSTPEATTSQPQSQPQQQQQKPAAPAAPSAPKTWANLAASGQNKWKTQVVAQTQGISSSAPTSGTSTPASGGPSTSATPASGEKVSEGGSRGTGQQQGQQGGPRFPNIETGHSIIVRGVGASVTHGGLRKKLSDQFAQQAPGPRGGRRWAKLAYIDIDRQKGVAYVDFEEEWPLDKANGASVELDGCTLTIEKGRGNRRDASGLGARGPGQGQGGAGRGRNPSGPGGRGGAQSGRGQPREGQQPGAGRNPKTGGRGGAGAPRA